MNAADGNLLCPDLRVLRALPVMLSKRRIAPPEKPLRPRNGQPKPPPEPPRPFHRRRPPTLPHKFLLALGKHLGRLLRDGWGLSGGWVAIVIVLVICLVGLLIASPFGIFFSDNGGPDTVSPPASPVAG